MLSGCHLYTLSAGSLKELIPIKPSIAGGIHKMKITQALFLIIIPYLLLGALDSKAQQTREMQSLEDHDFQCLKSLQCAQNSRSLQEKGWAFVFDETVDESARELTARMKGEDIYFYAVYDEEGDVIRSIYKQTDVALPNCLLANLTEGSYRGWQITGSEMVMKDFETSSVKYKVKLQNKTSATSEIFDFDYLNNLHLKHEVLAKHGLF